MNNPPSTKQDRGKIYLAVIVLANVFVMLLFAFANYSVYFEVNREGYHVVGWSPLSLFVEANDQTVHMTPVMPVSNLPFYVFCLALAVNLILSFAVYRNHGAQKQ